MRLSLRTWAEFLGRHDKPTSGKPLSATGLLNRLLGFNGGAQRMALATFAIRVAGALLAYVSQIILARWMGAHEYGIYAIVWTWVIVLGIIACAGFSSSPNRFIPEYDKAGDLARLRGFLLSSRLIAFGTALVIALLATTLIWLLSPVIEVYYLLPAMLVMLALPLFAVGGVQDGIARSYDWSSLAMLPTYIWRPLAILIGVFALLIAGQNASALNVIAIAVIATWIVAFYQMGAIHRRLRTRLAATPRQTDLRLWLSVSFPMLLVEGFFQLITSADVIMVSFWHNPDEVAVYFAASKTLALVHFVYFAVRAASAHRFSAFIHANQPEQLATYMRQASFWTFWLSLAAAAGLLLIAPLLLLLFGQGFADGYPILAILIIGVLARASVGPVDALLNMSGEQGHCARIYAITFAVNVALNCICIPLFGLVGAALASSLAIIIEAALLSRAARQKLQVSTFALGFLFNGKRAE